MTRPARLPGGGGRVLSLVAIGGAAGAVLRYQLGVWFPTAAGTFPVTTFGINVSGAFALGLLVAWLGRSRPADVWRRPLIGTGVLGGFTTFSTVCTETVLLVRAGDTATAAAYVALTLLVGVAAAALGVRVGGRGAPRVVVAGDEA